jgi:16S rRNA (adenine1518-N6/adenine1519-N6)-dimethyltransferase
LIDRNLMRKLIEAAELDGDDCVLEVGAGTGSLTGWLARMVGRVIAVEIDPKLADIAERHLGEVGNVMLIRADVLEGKSTVSGEVAAALRAASPGVGGHQKLVANLPYDIATPLVMTLLLGDLPLGRFCFTVQAEVAARFLARPNTAEYGPVAVITQVLATSRLICKVPARAFWPVPKVESAMIRLDRRSSPDVCGREARAFAEFVRSFFRHRRKTLLGVARRQGLAARLSEVIGGIGLPAESRPEDLSVGQWVDLYRGMC